MFSSNLSNVAYGKVLFSYKVCGYIARCSEGFLVTAETQKKRTSLCHILVILDVYNTLLPFKLAMLVKLNRDILFSPFPP